MTASAPGTTSISRARVVPAMSPSSSKGTGSSVRMDTHEACASVRPDGTRPARIIAPMRAQSMTRSGRARRRSTLPSSGVARGKIVMPPVIVPTLPSSAMTMSCSSGAAPSRATVARKGRGLA